MLKLDVDSLEHHLQASVSIFYFDITEKLPRFESCYNSIQNLLNVLLCELWFLIKSSHLFNNCFWLPRFEICHIFWNSSNSWDLFRAVFILIFLNCTLDSCSLVLWFLYLRSRVRHISFSVPGPNWFLQGFLIGCVLALIFRHCNYRVVWYSLFGHRECLCISWIN